jgi:uncharacterized coiled-coil protein SlyX
MQDSQPQIQALQSRFERCARSLVSIGPICQGSVIKRMDVRQSAGRTKIHGPYYLWTRRLKGKTLSVAISEQQYTELKQAIANHRKLEKTLAKMRSLTEKMIFLSKSGVRKRK